MRSLFLILLRYKGLMILSMDDLSRLPTENLNIRYLAWKEDANPEKWIGILRRKASLTEKEAKMILAGLQMTNEIRKAIIEGFNIDGDELGTARLFGLPNNEILKENIRYLIDSLPKGEKQKLAKTADVTKETVSRWAKCDKPPTSKNLSKITQYFKIERGESIDSVPLFLSLRPTGHFAQREWLKNQVTSLPAEELSRLFPALEKILDHHEDI